MEKEIPKQGTRLEQLELFVNINLSWLTVNTIGNTQRGRDAPVLVQFTPCQGLRVASGNLGLWYLIQLRPADLRPSDKN